MATYFLTVIKSKTISTFWAHSLARLWQKASAKTAAASRKPRKGKTRKVK